VVLFQSLIFEVTNAFPFLEYVGTLDHIKLKLMVFSNKECYGKIVDVLLYTHPFLYFCHAGPAFPRFVAPFGPNFEGLGIFICCSA